MSADPSRHGRQSNLTRLFVSRALLVCLLFCAPLAGAFHAGVDVDFGARVDVGDSAELYIDISSRYFDRDRDAVTRVAARFGHPDDLAVALFLGRHSDRSTAELYDFRRRGLSWWDISARIGVPVDMWFVEVARDPGPPYGKAYGHWKRHRRDRGAALVLSDADVRNLVAVRLLHEYYGVPVETAMAWRASGRDLRVLAAEEYHRRHSRSARANDGSHPGKARGRSRGKGHDKKR